MTRCYVTLMTRLRSNERGASAVEYGLLLGIIAVGLIAALGPLRDALVSLFTSVKNAITPAP